MQDNLWPFRNGYKKFNLWYIATCVWIFFCSPTVHPPHTWFSQHFVSVCIELTQRSVSTGTYIFCLHRMWRHTLLTSGRIWYLLSSLSWWTSSNALRHSSPPPLKPIKRPGKTYWRSTYMYAMHTNDNKCIIIYVDLKHVLVVSDSLCSPVTLSLLFN